MIVVDISIKSWYCGCAMNSITPENYSYIAGLEKTHSLRRGQRMYNEAGKLMPGLYELLPPGCDPYYNDENIPMFLDFLRQNIQWDDYQCWYEEWFGPKISSGTIWSTIPGHVRHWHPGADVSESDRWNDCRLLWHFGCRSSPATTGPKKQFGIVWELTFWRGTPLTS